MIERNLADVINDCKYLPTEFEWLQEKIRSCHDKKSEELSLSECWEQYSDYLKSDNMRIFWASCKYSENEIPEILNLLRPVIMKAVSYLGKEYLYTQSKPEEKTFDYSIIKEKLYIFFENEEQLENCTNFVINRTRNYQELIKMLDSDEGKKYDFLEPYKKYAPQICEMVSNTSLNTDPQKINPYYEFKQRKKYEEMKKNYPDTFFPELTDYIRKSVSNLTSYTDETGKYVVPGDEALVKEKIKDIHFSAYLDDVLLYLFTIGKEWLPGGSYASEGHWSMNALAKIEEGMKRVLDSLRENISSQTDKDKFLLTEYGFEDVLHLKRLASAIKKYIDYLREISELEEGTAETLAFILTAVVYAPSVEIGDFLLKDLTGEKIAFFSKLCSSEDQSGNGAQQIEFYLMTARFLSMNSVIFPSIVTSFTSYVFANGTDTIDSELINRRLSKPLAGLFGKDIDISSEHTAEADIKGNNWTINELLKEKYYYFSSNQNKEQDGGKRSKKYWFASIPKNSIKINELLTILMTQRFGKIFLNDIIIYNAQSNNLPETVLKSNERLLNKLKETFCFLTHYICVWRTMFEDLHNNKNKNNKDHDKIKDFWYRTENIYALSLFNLYFKPDNLSSEDENRSAYDWSQGPLLLTKILMQLTIIAYHGSEYFYQSQAPISSEDT